MKGRWKIALAVSGIAAVIVAIALTTGDSEPAYEGRTFSQWISAYNDVYEAAGGNPSQRAKKAQSSEAAQALCAMTPQILPTLIRWISYEKSQRAENVENFVQPLFERIGAERPFMLLTQKKQNRAWTALAVFEVLGTNAIPAIPQLSNMVMNAQHQHRGAGVNAVLALASTGNVGTQTILALLHNEKNPIRTATLVALQSCAPYDPDLVLAEIKRQLTNSDVRMRVVATNVLNDVH